MSYSGESRRQASEKFVYISLNKQNKNNKGQHPCQIGAHKAGKFRPFPLIRFDQEIFPAPAVTTGTEQQDDQRTERQHIITDDEIFQIHYSAAGSEGRKAGPLIETEYARHHQQGQQDEMHGNGFFLPQPHTSIL